MIDQDYIVKYPAVLSVTFSSQGSEIVTLSEAKAWCAIDGSDFDTIIEMLITAARQQCEGYANLSFISRTIEAKVKAGTRLPYGPVLDSNITGITDSDGNAVTMDYKDLKEGEYTVTYTVAQPTDARMKLSILNQVAYLFENRGDGQDGQLSPGAKAILKPIRFV